MFDANQLRQVLLAGESSTVEFKSEEVNPVSLSEEIVSFANLEGGTIYIGIADNGAVGGCSHPEKTEAMVVNVCRNNVRPPIIPVLNRVAIDGKIVLAVVIARGDTAYCTGKGQYHLRMGATKQIPTQYELLRLFQQRNILQFDETPVLKAQIADVDTRRISEYLDRIGQSPLDDSESAALMRELSALSVAVRIEDSWYPTLAGLLAFGKNPQHYFPSYCIQCGAYRGSDTTAPVTTEKTVAGTMQDLIDGALGFLRMVMPQDQSLADDGRRSDRFMFPIDALREAIVNAVAHRDYTISGSSIRISLFSDALEIRSPGALPNTLTVESMPFRQYTRNQSIASFLSGLGFMERRGKGISRIVRACAENGAEAHFELSPDKGEFVVRMARRG